MTSREISAIGIDVGGARKGFHAVALRGGVYAGQLISADVEALSHWCRVVMQATVIAIDAPCRWSSDGRPRPCERELMGRGIRCFASPTRATAVAHPSNYYGWMLQGEALYRALEPSHPLLAALPEAAPPTAAAPIAAPACFETFPHAITWHLRGGDAAAAQKRSQRSALLAQAGVALAALSSIDLIDAALCALTAQQAATGAACISYGETASGLIVVPALAVTCRSDPRGGPSDR
jgi:predicted nuclease with RNAse H fold